MQRQARSEPRPLVIIGGGIGMVAAIEAARCGLSSLVLDRGFGGGFADDLEREPREVRDRIEASGGTTVLEISPEREILWAKDHVTGRFRADQIILAMAGPSHGLARAIPFSGWTLPGVMAASEFSGLADRLRVHGAEESRRRALIAGIGNHALRAAYDLITLPKVHPTARAGGDERVYGGGVDVAAVLIAGDAPKADEPKPFPHDPLIARGVPILFGHTIVSAAGRDRVERATYGPIDPETWQPLLERAKTVDVDLVLVDFGHVANDDLAVIAGCRTRFDRVSRRWVVVRDSRMRTTVPGVLVADSGPSWVLTNEAKIAGITAAEHAGAIGSAEADRRRAEFQEQLRVADDHRQAWEKQHARLWSGLLELAATDAVVCPCEHVTLGAIRGAVAEGAKDLTSVKLRTRLGMGECQGHRCGASAGLILCMETGRTPEEVGRINPRPPAGPVTLGELARMRDDEAPMGVLESES